MDKYKIKNFILIMLVLVNIFLLFIVISNEISSERLRRNREDTLRRILLSNSIELDEGVRLDAEPLPEVSLTRSLRSEEQAVASLIGRCETSDLGGSIIYYDGDKGAARFRGTAEFELVFNPDVIYAGSDPEYTAADAMKRLGFRSRPEDAQVQSDSEDRTVILNLTYKSKPVFNSRISCYFVNGSLNIVEGKAFFSKVVSRSSVDTLPDACTILMRFLEYIKTNQLSCTEITAVESGYFAESTVVDECVMHPVWRISTDAGSFFMDGITGLSIQLDTRD